MTYLAIAIGAFLWLAFVYFVLGPWVAGLVAFLLIVLDVLVHSEKKRTDGDFYSGGPSIEEELADPRYADPIRVTGGSRRGPERVI